MTCVDFDRIINASESEDVLKVGTRDGKLPGLATRRKDELFIVNELLASFQHDLFSRDVNGSDSLRMYAPFRHEGHTEIRRFRVQWKSAR